MKRFLSVFLLASGLLVAGGASAAATLVFTESGGDVIATFSGTINTADLTNNGGSNPSNSLFPDLPFIGIGYTSNASDNSWSGVTYDSAWGTPGVFPNSSASGDDVYIYPVNNELGLPIGYVSGTTLNGTSTYANKTLATLNLTVGTYHVTWGLGANADSITVYVGTTPPAPAPTAQAIPTISEWSQMLLGLLVMTLLGWHFHKQRSY